MKKMFKLLVVSGVTLSLSLGVFSNVHAQNFKDIGSNHPEKAKVDSLVDKGVISGFEDGTFRPSEKVSRAQFAAFVARALDLPAATSSFKDVSKSSTLYSEVSSAYKAGIIKGFKDGSFKPNVDVSRADIAVMLDRALQSEGNFTKTISLPYSDAGSIGAYAVDSVKRMAAYSIMGAAGDTNLFSPTKSGNRLETVVSIHNMLKVTEEDVPVKPAPGKKDTEMTIAELTHKYGEHKLISRNRANGEFFESDLVLQYHDYYKKRYSDFNQFIEMNKESEIRQYSAYYPYAELISYNGKAYRSSEMYKGDIPSMDDEILPTNPTSNSEFLIDVHLNSKHTATYLKDSVITKEMANLPYDKNGDIIVDIETLLKDHINVKSTASKLTITHNGKVVEFTSGSNKAVVDGRTVQLKTTVERKNDKFMVPLRESASLLGLYTRTFTGIDVRYPNNITRIDLANYSLPADYKL